MPMEDGEQLYESAGIEPLGMLLMQALDLFCMPGTPVGKTCLEPAGDAGAIAVGHEELSLARHICGTENRATTRLAFPHWGQFQRSRSAKTGGRSDSCRWARGGPMPLPKADFRSR
jgi:hypothetical protein